MEARERLNEIRPPVILARLADAWSRWGLQVAELVARGDCGSVAPGPGICVRSPASIVSTLLNLFLSQHPSREGGHCGESRRAGGLVRVVTVIALMG